MHGLNARFILNIEINFVMNKLNIILNCKFLSSSPIQLIFLSLFELICVSLLVVFQYVDGINFGFPLIYFFISYFYLCLVIRAIFQLRRQNIFIILLFVVVVFITIAINTTLWAVIISGQPFCDYCP